MDDKEPSPCPLPKGGEGREPRSDACRALVSPAELKDRTELVLTDGFAQVLAAEAVSL